MNQKLRISLVQTAIEWENKVKNLAHVSQLIAKLANVTDVVVLPEMFSTGFSMNSKVLAENNEGETISILKQLANKYNLAICGSFIACEAGKYFNRGFFVTSEKIFFYDKRHLFAMGSEPEHFDKGKEKLIVNYKGFNICLLICYDLRFPVWSRNVNNAYDVLIYVANWPQVRIAVWNTLLKARAIENMAYVCGVNRFGSDNCGLYYDGNSALINPKGEILSPPMMEQDQVETIVITLDELTNFRIKFPVWKDADLFDIKNE